MKPAPIPIPALMWFVVLLLCAYLSIADPAKTNDTATSVCYGSVQDCLIGRHLEAEFSTITSSHFGRMLAEIQTKTAVANQPGKVPCGIRNKRYRDCYPVSANKGLDSHCSDPYYRGPECPH